MSEIPKYIKYFKSRLGRGFSLVSLGPNEARFFYDFLAGYTAVFLVMIFNYFFVHALMDFWLLLLPILLLFSNRIFGIYSYFKTVPVNKKAVLLLCSLTVVCLVSVTVGIAPALICLWGFVLAGPLIIPRILLGLPYSRHRELILTVVNQKGPVLVVGGAGYIGSSVVDLLLKEGKSLRVLDRLMYGKASLADFMGHRHFELIEGDATDIARLSLAMKDVSAVIHLAGLVGDPACAVDPAFTRHTNIVSTRMIKDVAQSMGVHRLIFASSCSVYGASDVEVKEGDDLNPVSIYAQTKIDSERELMYSVRDNFFITILRFATVFGHSRRPRFDLVANLFTAQGMTDGLIRVIGPTQWRPFIHVRDLAKAILMTLTADPPVIQGQIFNVGDKRLNMTIGQLGEQVGAVVAKKRDVKITVEDNILDKRNYSVSFEKIRTILGFDATVMLAEGIEEMVDHFNQGVYGNYRDEIYSNLAMTQEALCYFQDPMQTARLYAPIGEMQRIKQEHQAL
ncbi:NAD(P)-dependent oxidoreductase [Candidatus Parcubacteria bacterium]|nr:MAG: NAD(P)-dependent oxidoreductase [Candidatus Parcubacteria bacterium]